MAVAYVSGGISAAQMNALVDEIDDALAALYSCKSPLAFGATRFDDLMGLRFHFGDPAKRRILAGNTFQYDHDAINAIVTALGSMGTYDQATRVGRFREPTQAEYDTVAGMFGIQGFQTAAQLNNAWLFDWSLEPHRVTVVRGEVLRPWLSPDRNVRPEIILPYERLHDLAVADIIIEGWPSGEFTWKRQWSKFGCLRFHNLDFRTLKVRFEAPSAVVEIAPFGCKTVRQMGAADGIRTTLDASRNYLWRFRSGDAPIFDATRNRDAGVWGTYGYSSLASILLFHDILDHAGTRFHFDPRIRWNAASLYSDTFGEVDDGAVVAKWFFHGGEFRSLKLMPDGSTDSSVDEIAWTGNTPACRDLSIDQTENGLRLTSRHDGQHDVIALTTNALPARAHDITETPWVVDVGNVFVSTTRYSTTADEVVGEYYSLGQPVEVSVTINVLSQESIPAGATFKPAMDLKLGTCKRFGLPETETVDNGFALFGARGIAFDGRELLMSWTQTIPLTHAGLAQTLSDGYLSNWGNWELDETTLELRDAIQLANVATGYAVLPGRLDRYAEAGMGYESGEVWHFTDHRDISNGSAGDGQDFRWSAPTPDKPGLGYHGEAPSAVPTRDLPVYPVGSSWIRAALGSVDGAWWAQRREEILDGDQTTDDRRAIWRIPGAREHYNHVAARINALAGISPHVLFDLLVYGAPLNTGTGGVTAPVRFGGRLDISPAAKAIVQGFGLRIRTLADTSMAQFVNVPIPSDSPLYQPGENRTWLYVALPTIGLDPSDTLPTYEWIAQEDLVTIATAYGVPHFEERVRIPIRIELVRAWQQGFDGGWRLLPVIDAFFSDQEADFVAFDADDGAAVAAGAFAISTWRNWYTDPPEHSINRTAAETDSFLANRLFEPTANSLPAGAIERYRAVLLEQTAYGPEVSAMWQFGSDSKLLIQPEPHVNWTGTVEWGGDPADAPAAAIQAPPIDNRAVDLDTVMDGQASRMLNPVAVKAAWERGAQQDSLPWGASTMTYVTLVRRCGCFRR